jgi:Ser/Thr protein kinase RdoA (MazF antagonist)
MQEWVVGERFGREPHQAREAGVALARMHGAYREIGGLRGLPEGGFSDSDEVRAKLDAAVARLYPSLDDDQRALLDATVSTLRDHLARADERLVTRGLPLHESIPCHGDFHPGNTLWREGRLGAVIDFDRARCEAAAAEIANAALQFSLRPRVGSDPLQWQVGLEAARLRSFIEGYREHAFVDMRTVAPFAPWLMICAVVSEAAFPIAAEGNFGGIPGFPLLRACAGFVDWIALRTRAISEAFSGSREAD